MKNDEKIDINLTDPVTESELSQEEYFQLNYDTALRYINIAEHMKQFEDQDKYYHRAIQYLKKINDDGRYTSWIHDLRRLKFGARAQGKVDLYKEASRLRDTAKTTQDYYAAQTIFLRIARYEANHAIFPAWTEPALCEEALKCNDSAEQADYCEQMARQLDAKNRKKSLFASFVLLALVIAALAFSRTTECRRVLGHAFNLLGDYTSAYQKFNAVYERSGQTDQEAYNNYLEARYNAACDELEYPDTLATAYEDFKAVAKDNYKDSQDQLYKLELDEIKNTELTPEAEVVHFASMEWRILDKQEDKVLLIKDKAINETAFNDTAGPCTWETSSIRAYLNGAFIRENFYKSEEEALSATEIKTTENATYPGVNPGNVTTDRVFLLSAEEVKKYVEQLHETETCWWLRTPGAAAGSMAFVYRNKEVMPYGYDVTNTEITVKPAIWITLK